MTLAQIFKEISIGGLSQEELIHQLVEAGIQFNQYANTLFEHPTFSPSKDVVNAKLIKINLSELNLNNPCSLQKLMTQASQIGLKPCPLYLGAFLRLEYLDQPEGPYLTIISSPLENDENDPTGFYIRNFDQSLWLRGYQANGDTEWPSSNEFIFLSN